MGKKIIIILIIIIINLGYFNKNFSLAKKNTDLFNGIIDITQATIVENALKANFEIEGDGESYCLDLFKKMQIDNADVNVVRDNNIYSLEFKKNGLNGYIESIDLDNHNVVTLNLVIDDDDNENKISELKDLISTAVGKDEKYIQYFQYLKAKLPNDNLEKTNENIVSFLKDQDAINIDTTMISNGYSTVAFTRKYLQMKNNGKLMDFNFAVCSYSSGNYVIIGTPIIFTTY